MAYCNKSRSPVKTRNAGAKGGNSKIEREWNDDPWLHDVKSMRGRSTEISVFNAEKREAKAAYSKHREFHMSQGIRVGTLRSTEKPFNPTDHHAKIKSKPKTGKDSKKPKEPISPAKKLSKLLISLFLAGGTKKTKRSSPPPVSDSTSYHSSERKPSVYSYYSSVETRPCLSKTSKGYSNNRSGIAEKSVTFCPTSANVDWDFRPYGEKCLRRTETPDPNPTPCSYSHTDPSKRAYKLPLLEKDSYAVAATTKDIISKHQRANAITEAVTSLNKQDKEDEKDVASCSSSDLFELDNLADIDMNMYESELPVYETTHWDTNKAIAKGLIV